MSAISATNCTHRGMVSMAAGSEVTYGNHMDKLCFLEFVR
jgi:hypothetical protein